MNHDYVSVIFRTPGHKIKQKIVIKTIYWNLLLLENGNWYN